MLDPLTSRVTITVETGNKREVIDIPIVLDIVVDTVYKEKPGLIHTNIYRPSGEIKTLSFILKPASTEPHGIVYTVTETDIKTESFEGETHD